MDLPAQTINLTIPEPDPLTISPGFFTLNDCEIPLAYCKEYCEYKGTKTYEDVSKAIQEAFDTKIWILTGTIDKETNQPKSKPAGFDRELIKYRNDILTKVANSFEVYPPTIDSTYLEYLKTHKKPSPKDFLLASHLLLPDMQASNLVENLNNLKNAVNVLWDRIANIEAPEPSLLYLFSDIQGGTGKSLFWTFIETWAREKGVKVSATSIPTDKFCGSEYSKNAICYVDEATVKDLENWPRINPIINGTNYKVEEKGSKPYYPKTQCLLVIASNFKPLSENNPRRLERSYVSFRDSFKITDPSFHKYFLLSKPGIIDKQAYVPIVEKWILSAPEESFDYSSYVNTVFQKGAKWRMALGDDGFIKLQQILQGIRSFDTTKLWNATNVYYRLKNNNDIATKDLGVANISSILMTLSNKGLIKRAEKDNVNLHQVEYDLSPVFADADEILLGDITYGISGLSARDHNIVIEEAIVQYVLSSICTPVARELHKLYQKRGIITHE